MLLPSSSVISFAETENTGKALELTLQTLDRLKKEGVTAEMLESARAYVLGQYPLNFETVTRLAHNLDVQLCLQQAPHALPQKLVIVR